MAKPKAGFLHTPPPVDESRSYLSEQSEKESYGLAQERPDHLAQVDETIEVAGSISGGNQENGRKDDKEAKYAKEAKDGKERDAKGEADAKDEKDVKNRKSSVGSVGSGGSAGSAGSAGSEVVTLPPRLSGHVERFLVSLQEPRYSTPLTGDDISRLYAEFYDKFHAAASSYLRNSGPPPPSSVQALESVREIAEKKRERTRKEARLRQYEELAEAIACDRVYDKIFTLSFSSDNDSKTNDNVVQRLEALRQLPLTLVHLDLKEVDEAQLHPLLKPAGEELHRMNESRTPVGKLTSLFKAHQVIVEALSSLLQSTSSSSSADLILPALIYTFVFYETPDLWLNLQFITRFRNRRYLQGEHMYCLTNLEAAVGFLRSVTLDTLGIKASDVPKDLDVACLTRPSPARRPSSVNSGDSRINDPLGVDPPTTRSRSSSSAKKLSSMLYSSDIADQGLKSLATTYRFFVGKFSQDKSDKSEYPSTLEDARKVVGLDTPTEEEGAATTATGAATGTGASATTGNSTSAATGASGSASTTTHAATPGTESTLTVPENESNPSLSRSSSNNALFGKFSNLGVIKRFYEDTPPPSSKLAKPIDRLVSADTDQLKVGDIKKLHDDYKRLVKYLKSIDAFE